MSDEVQNAGNGSPAEGHEGGEGSFKWTEAVTNKELLNDPTIANLSGKSLDDVLQSHIDAQKYMGSAVKIPGSDASDEDWNKFYNKVRPSDVSEYKFNYPESEYTDDATKEWFINNAHEVGLTTRQAERLAGKHISFVEEAMTKQAQDAEKIIEQKISDNKKALGGEYDKTMNMFERTIKAQGGDKLWNELQASPLIDDLSFIKMVSDYGNLLGEDKLITADDKNRGRTVESVKKEIADLRETDEYKSGFGKKFMEVNDQIHKKYEELVEIKRNQKR